MLFNVPFYSTYFESSTSGAAIEAGINFALPLDELLNLHRKNLSCSYRHIEYLLSILQQLIKSAMWVMEADD